MTSQVVVAAQDPGVKESMSQLFEDRDCHVIYEPQGSGALLKALQENIDILIYDFIHEDDSSLDFITIVRSMKPRLPVITLTENTSVEVIRKLSEAGVFYCALKPVQIGEMEKVIVAVENMKNRTKQTTPI